MNGNNFSIYTICPGCGRMYNEFLEGMKVVDPMTERVYRVCVSCVDGENGEETDVLNRCREYAAGKRTYENYSINSKYRPFEHTGGGGNGKV